MLILLVAGLILTASAASARELSLAQAVEIASANHPDLRQAELRLAAAQFQLESAQAQAYWPSISVTLAPSGSFFSVPRIGLAANLSIPLGTSNNLGATLALGWNESDWSISYAVSGSFTVDLTNPMGAASQLENLSQSVKEAEEALSSVRSSVIISTIKSYTDVLALKARLDLAEANLAKAEATVKQTEDAISAGLSGELDLLQARLSLTEAQIALEQARSAYTLTLIQFAQSLGLTEGIEVTPIELLTEPLLDEARKLLAETSLEEVVGRSSAVLAAERTLEEAKKSLERARWSLLPTITVEAGWNEKGLQLNWTLRFALFSPTYEAGVKLAETQVALAQLNVEVARRSAYRQLLELQSSLESAIQSLERLPMELDKWAMEEELYRKKYELGSISEADLQSFLQEKEAFLVEVQQRGVSLLLSYLNYKAAMGLSLDWEGWIR